MNPQRFLDVLVESRFGNPAKGAGTFRSWMLTVVLAVFVLAPTLRAERAATVGLVRLTIDPGTFRVHGPRDHLHFIVTGHYDDGSIRDLTRVAEFTSSATDVIAVDEAVAQPARNGTATITASVGVHRSEVTIEATGQSAPQPVSFRYETLAVLTKQDCNSGGCHGAPAGKAGFRLSLFAFDPELDAFTLTREEAGRRTNRFLPEASLILNKPLMLVPHGGGRRLRKREPGYGVLRDWIAEGCRIDTDDAPACTHLEVLPGNRVLHFPAVEQQLLVLGHFADGRTRDVSHLASYFSADETIATVDESGLVSASAHGEAAVVVRYLEQVAAVRLTFIKRRSGVTWHAPAVNNYVDRHVFAKLQQMQYPPSELCSDAQFMRRASLDVTGLLPTAAAARAFVEDPSPDKRERLIDELLERPEYALFWATHWGDLLRVKKETLNERGASKIHEWLVRSVATNLPYDEFVSRLLLAEGDTFENPPANYYRAAASTDDCTETTAQTFLGLRLQCAKCHNHPYERWTQDNYYGLGAFFNRVQRTTPDGRGALSVWVARDGEITQPRTGQTMKPWLPQEGEIHLPPETDRRRALVRWLRKPENPFLARVEVNRIWSYLMGRGIVDPIDDFRDSNPASNPELLDALTLDFVGHGYDRKYIIATILKSRTYQLDSVATDANRRDQRYFSHARARRLSAEQLLDAMRQVAGVRQAFPGLPANILATQLPDPGFGGDFLRRFGKPARNTACECERSGSPDLAQAMELTSGTLVDNLLRDPTTRFRKQLAGGQPLADIIEDLHWRAFSRAGSTREKGAAIAYVSTAPTPVEGLEDLLWALFNAKEFLFQH